MYVYTRCLFGHYGSYFVYIYDAPNKLFKDKKKKKKKKKIPTNAELEANLGEIDGMSLLTRYLP